MDLSVRTIIEGHLTLFLFALFLGLLACFMAWYRGYFKWSPPDPKKIRLPLRSLIMAFALYLSVFFLFPFLLRFISFFLSDERKESLWVFRGAVNSWIHIFEITLVVFFLFFYLSFLSSDVRKTVWGDGSYQGFRKNAGHFGMGVVTWLISFPIVIAVSQAANLLLLLSHLENKEQLAVQSLKFTMDYPVLFGVTAVWIVVWVPVIEELLFRGFLQNWLVRFTGKFWGILATSLIFSGFHFSWAQGGGNAEIIPSLFALSCFLGFIYYRQRSVYASIGLHAAFNGINVLLMSLSRAP